MSGRRVLIALIGALAFTACGIGAEDTPRDVPPKELAAGETDSPAVSGSGQRLWMIAPTSLGGQPQLRAVYRDPAATPAELLNLLLASVTLQERGERISTAIPLDTKLIQAKLLGDGLLLIDLTDDFLKISDDLLVDAVAQIVFTGSEFDGVDRIQLLIEGEPREWERGNDAPTSEPLTVFDFPEHVATSQPDFPAVPSREPPEPEPT